MSPTSGYHTGRAPMGGQVAMSLIKQLLAIYQNDQEELINDIRLISSHSVAHSVSSKGPNCLLLFLRFAAVTLRRAVKDAQRTRWCVS